MTLTEFLLARIAEDEADARAVKRGPAWSLDDRPSGWGVDHDPEIIGGGKPVLVLTDYDLMVVFHVVRWYPARVLAECEAKRRIVEYPLSWPSKIRAEYRSFTFVADDDPRIVNQWSTDDSGDLLDLVRRWKRDDYERDVVERTDSPILRLLALPYADHPDYRVEWRP